ncbi:MAG: AraC family transcriptional regulator [Dorea sp.]|nr:AraC family transcriptional regulator [Dorea sp.]
MNNFDIPTNVKWTNENSRGSISYLIDVYQDPQNLTLTGFIKMHSHPEIQLCYVTRGEVEFIVENIRYTAAKGEVVYINSNCIHMSRALEQGSTYVCFNIKPEYLIPFLSNIDGHRYIYHFLHDSNFASLHIRSETGWQEKVIQLLKNIYRLYQEQTFAYELQIVSCLVQLWYEMIHGNEERILDRDSEETLSQKRIKRALKYIEEHYQETIELRDIAEELGVSNGEVSRLFKKMLNETCFEHIGNYRIMRSMDLLNYTDMSISEIALKTGFNSFSYYTKYFKNKVGCSPSAYRNQIKQHE